MTCLDLRLIIILVVSDIHSLVLLLKFVLTHSARVLVAAKLEQWISCLRVWGILSNFFFRYFITKQLFLIHTVIVLGSFLRLNKVLILVLLFLDLGVFVFVLFLPLSLRFVSSSDFVLGLNLKDYLRVLFIS